MLVPHVLHAHARIPLLVDRRLKHHVSTSTPGNCAIFGSFISTGSAGQLSKGPQTFRGEPCLNMVFSITANTLETAEKSASNHLLCNPTLTQPARRPYLLLRHIIEDNSPFAQTAGSITEPASAVDTPSFTHSHAFLLLVQRCGIWLTRSLPSG